MSNIINTQTLDGKPISFVDEVIGQGSMKDVYMSPCKTYVVAFYKTPLDAMGRDRVQNIIGRYHDGIFNNIGGDYWKKLFCWPTALVEHNEKVGIVMPTYAKQYFFEIGSKNNDILKIKGKEKEGKWFAAPNLRNRFIDPKELGDWLNHLKISLMISRAVRRMHMAGLAHSDLSYKNVLIDPTTGSACIIDVDGLVVPGKYPPDVVGTPDFSAPEVVKTSKLPKDDQQRALPSQETDRHALAVLIYMYLLYRHPLRGRKVHDVDDTDNDEFLAMGEKALFVEHPTDKSNRINVKNAKPTELPWVDTDKLPFTLTGPYLSELFKRAFVDGLHDPALRPSANEWETALVKSVDLVQPCHNPDCEQKWYVFDNTMAPKCPFCGTPFKGKLPVLNLYSARKEGAFRPDNHRLMVWTGQSLFWWHANNLIVPNEKLTDEHKKRVGYFVHHNDVWWLVNEGLTDLMDVDTKTPIPLGGKVELTDGKKLLLDRASGGRLVVVQMVAA